MAAWVMVVFGTLAPFFYSSGLIISNLFKTKTHSLFILYLLPIIYIIGLLPENIVEVNEILGNLVNYFAIVSVMVMPTIIFVLGYIKKRRKKSMKRKILFILIPSMIFLSGCWDMVEINQRLFVSSIGIDLNKESGMNKYIVTYAYPNINAIGKNASETTKKSL